jgi:hypothetical protein
MRPNTNPIMIGIIAGLVAAIGTAGSLAMPFIAQLIAMIALFMAGLGYGRIAGLIAVATAAVALGVFTSSLLATFIFGVSLLPAAVMSQLALLARPASELGGPEDALAWYPLSDVLLGGAVLVALATISLLLLQPADQLYGAAVEAMTAMLGQDNPQFNFTPEQKAQMVATLRTFGPASQSAGSMVMLFAGFYFAMLILSAMKRNVRPREDIRSSLRMSRLSIAVFIGGIALMFVGGTPAIIGGSFAGAVGGGFLLSGFAVIHNAVREKSWALPGLILVYLLALFIPPVPMIIAVAGGLANPRRAVALTPAGSTPTSDSKN